MVRQFLRRMFAGRKNDEEHETRPEHIAAESYENDMEMTKEVEPEPALPFETAAKNKELEVPRAEPRIYTITRDKIEHHSYKEMMNLVEEILEQVELGLRSEGRLQLRLSPELIEETDEFFAKRIGKYIEGAERETYDATAFFDWQDKETARIYRTYVLPAHPEKQQTFMQGRLVMIYDTCEALAWDARQIAKAFAEAVHWELTDEDFRRFEKSMETISQRLQGEGNELLAEQQEYKVDGQPSSEKEDEFAHITPIQISREEVENENIAKLASFFDRTLSDPKQILEKKGGLVFSFYGFSGELEDVMGDEAVNVWASRLVEQYPYVFYFLNDQYVPMTRFVTSMVVKSRVEGDAIVYDEQELEEFVGFIGGALTRIAEWTEEDPRQVIEEFEQKLFS